MAKPIHRAQFILGKYLGLVLTLFIMTVLMAVIFLAVLFFHTFRVEWPMLTAILFIFLELMLITAVAILFSTFSTPILSSIFSLSFYLIGHLSWGLETLIRKMRPGAGRTLARVLYTFLPDLENFNFKTEVVHGLPIPPQNLRLFDALRPLLRGLHPRAGDLGFPKAGFHLTMHETIARPAFRSGSPEAPRSSCSSSPTGAGFMGLKLETDKVLREKVPGSSIIYVPSGKFLKYADVRIFRTWPPT